MTRTQMSNFNTKIDKRMSINSTLQSINDQSTKVTAEKLNKVPMTSKNTRNDFLNQSMRSNKMEDIMNTTMQSNMLGSNLGRNSVKLNPK